MSWAATPFKCIVCTIVVCRWLWTVGPRPMGYSWRTFQTHPSVCTNLVGFQTVICRCTHGYVGDLVCVHYFSLVVRFSGFFVIFSGCCPFAVFLQWQFYRRKYGVNYPENCWPAGCAGCEIKTGCGLLSVDDYVLSLSWSQPVAVWQ
jgi:hypothetical protein